MSEYAYYSESNETLNAKKLMENMIDQTDEKKINFLKNLNENPPAAQQIAGFAMALRSKSKIKLKYNGLTDIVGTGGDGKNTVNVSTGAGLLLASMGIKIAKHGNFGITGHHGSADFMKYLNYKFDLTCDEIMNNLDKNNYVFLLAPQYNDNFAKFAKARKSLPFRTVFNVLGPITNPLDPDKLVLGSYSDEVARIYAGVLLTENKTGFSVHSCDGLDELSPMSKNKIYYVNGSIEEITVDGPAIVKESFSLEDISEKDNKKSFEMLLSGLNGKNRKIMKFIALNAAPSLVLNKSADSIEEGYIRCVEYIESGKMKNIPGVSK